MSRGFLFLFSFSLLMVSASGQGEGFKRDTAWEVMLSQNPEVVDDASIGWMDRLILDVLTPEQARAYFAGKASDEDLTLGDGETLAAYVGKKLDPGAHVYIPLVSPCRLFDLSERATVSGIQTMQSRGNDLSLQGGSPFGCAIPEEAATLVLQLEVRSVGGFPAKVKLWSADGPEPAGIFHEEAAFDFPLSYETTLVVPVCDDCAQGEFQLKLSEAAAVTGEVVGYFRSMTAGDAPGGGISFYTEGPSNNFFGTAAGSSNTGLYNSFFGAYAGQENTTGSSNSLFGANAGDSNTEGTRNSFFGDLSGQGNSSGSDNSFFGANAGLSNTTGEFNSFFGESAGSSNTTASFNSFFGQSSGTNNTGTGNSFFGQTSGTSNTSGYHNSFFGYLSGYSNNTGINNSFFGMWAGNNNTVEDNNTFIGAFADLDPGSDPETFPVVNATAVGYLSYVSQSNSLVLGSIAGVHEATDNVKVGIGSTAPESPLHVKRTDGTAQILVEDTGIEPTLTTLQMKNNGRVQVVYENTDSGDSWQLSQHLTGFVVSLVGTGGAEFRVLNDGSVEMGPGADVTFDLDAAGNLIIAGNLTELSDRDEKENIVPVNSKEVLEQVAQLPIAQWTRKGDEDEVRHVGPMAQDFYKAFAVGVDDRHLATVDTSGIALAAIQGLNEKLEEKDAEIQSLRTELEKLERLEAELAEIKQLLSDK